MHELLGWSLLALVLIHVLAVVAMSLLTRDNLVRAMVSGTKPADRHPAGGDAHAPGPFAYLVGAIAIVAAAWGVTNYDPQVFTLRSVESYEHQDQLQLVGDMERLREHNED